MRITPFTCLLAFVCFTSQILAINPGQLGLKLNAPLAESHMYVYNAIVQFEEDIQGTWTDEQIVGIAKQAFEDMQADKEKNLAKPNALSVIVKGHSVYISSSLRGGSSFLYIPNANTDDNKQKYTPGNINQASNAGVLARALMECQFASTSDAGHRTGANCGEMMAAMAFVRTSPNGVLDNSPVVTWGRYRPLDDQGKRTWKIGVMNPCGPAQGFGCLQVLPRLGMRAIRSGTAARDTPLNHDPTVTYPCFD